MKLVWKQKVLSIHEWKRPNEQFAIYTHKTKQDEFGIFNLFT